MFLIQKHNLFETCCLYFNLAIKKLYYIQRTNKNDMTNSIIDTFHNIREKTPQSHMTYIILKKKTI